ncbi:MAG: hypothetical protein JST98_06475 [Bacteroidetes bacterium]|nr:hypothetical protein [Bacteroidota bacterium]
METFGWTTGGARGGIITSAVDEELERYQLLAYLQQVDARFREHKLYPLLDDIRIRIDQLRQVADGARTLDAQMPGEVVGLDLVRGELRRKPVAPDAAWEHVRHIFNRAMPALEAARERGEELRDELNAHIRMEAVGVVPLDAREGWLLLRQGGQAVVYAYVLPLVREVQAPDPYRHVRTQYYATCTLSLVRTYERIKADLVRSGPLPNPAMFAFEADITLPRMETFLPLAKRITYEVVAGRRE